MTEVKKWLSGEGTGGRLTGKGHKGCPPEVTEMFYILFWMVVAQVIYLWKLVKMNI